MIVSKISDMKELFMKKLLLVFFFIFLAITVFPIEPVKIVAGGLKTLEIDYWLDTYFDFATGESFTEKRDGKSNELIWRKQNEKAYQVKRQYEKYQLSYPEPVIVLLTRKGYSFEWWDIERHSHGWKFWKWDWYILRDRCVSRTSPVYWVSDLIQVVLDQCNPSKEEAQRIYAETIRLIREKNDKSVDLFLQDSYVKFHAEEFRKELTGYLNGGEILPDTRLLRLMEWERNRYPDVLPKHLRKSWIYLSNSPIRKNFRPFLLRAPHVFLLLMLPDSIVLFTRKRNIWICLTGNSFCNGAVSMEDYTSIAGQFWKKK